MPNGLGFSWRTCLFVGPALLIYAVFNALPLLNTFRQAFFAPNDLGQSVFVGLANFQTLLGDAQWAAAFGNALSNNLEFFAIHMLVQNPLALLLAALLSLPYVRYAKLARATFLLPAVVSVVMVGFVWRILLSPDVSEHMLSWIGLAHWVTPWLGLESSALVTISLISVWQNVGVSMLLIYVALAAIPQDILEAAYADGASFWRIFWRIRLPLIWPSLVLVAILTYVNNFNAFDLIYTLKGSQAGPNYSTDLLGTLFYRTTFGSPTPSSTMGSVLASLSFLIILLGAAVYMLITQRRLFLLGRSTGNHMHDKFLTRLGHAAH